MYGHVLYGWPSYVARDNFDLYPFFQRKDELTVEQGILMWGCKVNVSVNLRKWVFNELYGSHLGISKMISVARSYVWWPNINQDI